MQRRLIQTLVAVLLILHYDFWLWSDRSLMLGFMPVGLFYQVLISLLAAVLWAVVVKYAWPSRVEVWASRPPDEQRAARGDDGAA